MAITFQNSTTKPEVVYDRFHLLHLEINQPLLKEAQDPPIFELNFSYRLYGLGSDNMYYYAPKVYHVKIPDYLPEAYEKWAQGNPALLQAFGAIEQALSVLITEKTDLGATTII